MAVPVTNTGYRDGGKTSEAGIHRITRGLYTREGVILSGDLQATQNGTPDTNVLIATGDIVIGTTSPYTTFPPYFYHSWVATAGLVAIAANASGSARIDSIVAYIDLTVTSSASNDNPGALKFMDVQGTPAGSPVAPTDAQIQAAVGGSNPWVLLAVVNVANGFATIVNANITDCRPMADTGSTTDSDQTKASVATGLLWAATSGLSAANSAGRAYATLVGGGGRMIYKPAITHLFTASKDTYVDLPPTAKATMNDDFTYTPVTNGAAAPALAAGSIRLAKVVTSGAAVTSIITSGQDSLGNQFMPKPVGTNQIELGAVVLTSLSTQLQNNVNLGWLSLSGTFSYNANNGQKEFVMTTPSDLSGQISPGMRFKCSRNVAPPTQAMAFVAASSQYGTKASPTGITFTGPFTTEAWIYPTAYTGNAMGIIGRSDDTTTGFQMELDAGGRLAVYYAAASAFTNFISVQTIPLNRWTHVAAVVTSVASKTAVLYINGAVITNISSLLAATTLVQGSNLSVGGIGAGVASRFFNGYISEARVWSTNQTAANVLANMAINLVGNETNLVALYQGNGVFTDGTANANTLTATGGAIATQAANPYNSVEQFIITKVTSTQLTLFGGTDYNLPNQTVLANSSNYSIGKTPFGFPSSRGKWRCVAINKQQANQAGPTSGTWYNLAGMALLVPIGEWDVGYEVSVQHNVSAGDRDIETTLTTVNNTETDNEYTVWIEQNSAATVGGAVKKSKPQSLTAQTTFYLNTKTSFATSSTIYNRGDNAATIIEAVSGWA